MESYKGLKVYQKSYELAKEMYMKVASKMPKEEQYGLASQVKRASTSIPLNIAEGYGKWCGEKELIRFLMMARGSCCEMEVLLSFSKDFGYISEEEYARYSSQYEEIGKMLTGLMKSVSSNTND